MAVTGETAKRAPRTAAVWPRHRGKGKALIPLLVVSLAGAAGTAAAAPEPPEGAALTVEEATRAALRQNRLVRVAEFEIEKAEAELKASRAQRYPHFGLRVLSTRLTRPFDLFFQPGAFGTFENIGPVPPVETTISNPPRLAAAMMATIVQPITQQFRISAGLDLLRLGRELARERLRQQSQTVANDVKRVYYGLVQAQAGLEVVEGSLLLLHELDRTVATYLEKQMALPADQLEVRAQLAQAEQQRLELTNTLATLREQMNALLGRDLGTAFQVVPVDEPVTLDADLATVQARALEQRPEMREARLKKDAASADERFKRTESIPEVSVVGGYLGLRGVDVFPRDTAGFGLMLSWEPFDWGRKGRELAMKKAVTEQAGAGVKEAEALVLVDVNHRFRKLQEARARFRATSAARTAAQEQLRVMRARREQESVLVKDLLQAQTALAAADQRHLESLAAFWTALADLEKATGEP